LAGVAHVFDSNPEFAKPARRLPIFHRPLLINPRLNPRLAGRVAAVAGTTK